MESKNNSVSKKYETNKRILNELEKNNEKDKKTLQEMIDSIKETSFYGKTILGIGTLGPVASYGIISVVELLNKNPINDYLSIIYATFIVTGVIVSSVPFYYNVKFKKESHGCIERIAAQEYEMSKISHINKKLKNDIQENELKIDDYISSSNDIKELENLKKYLNIVSYYGCNRDKLFNLHQKGKMSDYLKRKGFDSQSIEYLNKYIREQVYPYDKDCEENIFEEKPYTLKYK